MYRLGFRTRSVSLQRYRLLFAVVINMFVPLVAGFVIVHTPASSAIGPGGFDTNLELWLKEDTAVYSNTGCTTVSNPTDTVSCWVDQSGNAYSLVENGNSPILGDSADATFNYNQFVTYTNDDLQNATDTLLAADSDATVFIVGRKTASGGQDAALAIGQNGGGEDPLLGTNGTRVYVRDAANYQTGVGFFNNNQTLLFEYRWTDGVDTTIGVDNNTISKGSAHVDTAGGTHFSVGGDNGGAKDWAGSIAEVIVYSSEYTGVTRNRIMSYLAVKYGITLDQTTATDYTAADGTTLFWEAANNVGYDNDIAGIGNDSDSQLDQQKSQSANIDFIVIGSNPSAMASGEFFMWANDDGSTAATSGEVPGGTVSQRLTREWKVDHTGDVGTVTLEFDLSQQTALTNTGNGNDFSLLIDTDGNFSNATIHTTGANIVGNILTFTNVTIADGEYFTIADFSPTDDFGDAPDTGAGTGAGNYETLDTSGGPKHTVNANIQIGAGNDLDNGSAQNAAADADDTNNTDDEDGIVTASQLDIAENQVSPTIDVTVTNNTGSAGTLYGWIDYDGDGDFENATERASVAVPTGTTSGNVSLVFPNVPATANTDTGGTSYLRLRLSTDAAAANSTGAATDGEVEDHLVTVLSSFDYGDAPDTGAGTGAGNYETLNANGGPKHTVNANIQIGAANDQDSGTAQDATATADDNAQTDDEDGIITSTQLALVDNQIPTIDVTVTNNTGSAATLYGWIDYDDDGDFENATERASVAVPTGTTAGTVSLVFPVVPNTGSEDTGGTSFLRLRLSTDAAAANSTGSATDGEVEDHAVTIQDDTPGPGGVATNLQLWLREDIDVYTDAACTTPSISTQNVRCWKDQSGNTYDVTDGVNAAIPVLGDNTSDRFNFNDYLEFPGTGTNRLHNATATLLPADTDGSIFVVGQKDSNVTFDIALQTNPEFGTSGGNLYANDASAYTYTSALMTLTQPHIFEYRWIDDTDTIVGLDNDTGASGAANIDIAAGGVNFTVGNRITGGRPWGGDIAEVIVYDTNYTNNDRLRIMSYLGVKYGITLDQTTATNYLASSGLAVWNAADNTGYDNDIAGIGLDALSSLNQQTSQSANPDVIVRGSTPSNLDDKEYFIWANDDGSTATTSTEVPPLTNDERLTREWKVDHTGDVGTVTLAFNLAQQTALADTGNAADYALLIDSDGNFSDATVHTTGASYSAGTVSFTSVAIPDGSYFTLSSTATEDFGDAPDTGAGTGAGNYETLDANGGPKHTVNANIQIGANVDADTGTVQGAAADGDDNANLDDDDGVVTPAQLTIRDQDTTPTVDIQVTNNTGSAAVLYGWIDFNGDGVFDNGSERTSVAVPDGTTASNVSLVFPNVPSTAYADTGGTSYLRTRLSTDAAAANPNGAATDGEVEDHFVTVLPDGDIQGTVYRDYNEDGDDDTLEPGIAGVTVTATCSLDHDTNPATPGINSFTATTTTDANGNYLLSVLNGYDCRVEFTGQASYLDASPQGTDNNSTVRFVSMTSESITGIKTAFTNPADYCASDPQISTTCYAQGAYNGGNSAESAIATNLYSDGGNTASNNPADFDLGTADTNATWTEVGATNGAAWQSSTNTLFTAAYMKKFAGFGASGPGAIYSMVVNPDTGATTTAASLWLDIYTLAGVTTCVDPHAGDINPVPTWVTAAFAAVGKCSMADIEISEDNSTLYVVNLTPTNGGQILAIDIATKTLVGGSPWAVPLTQGDCPAPATDIHPGALKVEDEMLYFGLTCGADSTGLTADLRVYVYQMDPAVGIGSATQILNESMDYARNLVEATGQNDWFAWTDDPTTVPELNDGTNTPLLYQGTPWLADIEIAGNVMTLGIRDRMGDQGPRNGPDNAGATLQDTVGKGDILCAEPNGANWQFESNGVCNGNTGTATHDDGGPGGQEFFEDGTDAHFENSFGTLAHAPGFSDITYTALSPNDLWLDFNDTPVGLANGGGLLHNSLTDGTAQRGYLLYTANANTNLGKVNGLGDTELLCKPAPIEVGNRVWNDADNDGIQDEGEANLSGVTVQLIDTDNTTVLGTATTDASGRYYFSTATGTSTASVIYGVNMSLSTANYKVRIDTTQAALAGYTLVAADADASPNGDLRDSDASLSGTDAEVTFTTGGAGENNHTFDVGFNSSSTSTVGNLIFNDKNNNGLFDNDDSGLDGVTVELYVDTNTDGDYDAGTDTLSATTTTAGGGAFSFTGLANGEYIVVVPASEFGAGQELEDYVSATGDGIFGSSTAGTYEPPPDPDNDTNNDDNGGIVGTVVATFAVTIASGAEPTNDGDADANTNLSVDLGFYIPQHYLTLALDDNTMDLGVLSPSAIATQTQQYTLSTNNPAGAVLSFLGEAIGLDDGSGNDIDNVADGTITAGSEEYGLSMTSGMTLVSPFDSGDDPIPTASTNFANSGGAPVTGGTVDFTYKASVNTATVSGAYDQVVTVTVVANP